MSSLPFLFGFLAVGLLLYYATPLRTVRYAVLFCLSMALCIWEAPPVFPVLIGTIVLTYFLGLGIAHYKKRSAKKAAVLFCLSLLLTLLPLLLCRLYTVPTLSEHLMRPAFTAFPAGIAFCTLRIISYTVDLYCDRTDVQKNIIRYSIYASLFVYMSTGPIVLYHRFANSLESREESLSLFAGGVRRFILGLSKKILLADTLFSFHTYFSDAEKFTSSVIGSWMSIVCFGLFVYFDLSGYADMAIGLGRMFGFRFPQNLMYPLTAHSVTDLCRRFFTTLHTWLNVYIYDPFFAKKEGRRVWRICSVIAIGVLVTLWHGTASTVLLAGAVLILSILAERSLSHFRIPQIVSRIYTLVVLSIGLTFLSHADAAQAVQHLLMMIGVRSAVFCTPTICYQSLRVLPVILIAILCATPLPKTLWIRLCGVDLTADHVDAAVEQKRTAIQNLFCCLSVVCLMLLLVLCIAHLTDSAPRLSFYQLLQGGAK